MYRVLGWSALCFFAAAALTPSAASAETWVVGRDGLDFQAVLDRASDGDRVDVPRGVWRGSFRITKRLRIEGQGGVLDGGGQGTVLTIAAPAVSVRGLEIRGSGDDLGGPDSCIRTTKEATEVIVERNALRDCAFGIWVEASREAKVLSNVIEGRANVREADRGNGIHVFNAEHVTVKFNEVRAARDGIYISCTHASLIAYNKISDLRYGIHYMFANRNVLLGNESRRNLTGLALMQSRDLVVIDNIVEDNARHGILFRDAQNSSIRGNRVERNTEGFFLFSSTDNRIESNLLINNEVGAKIWAGTVRNSAKLNVLRGNRQQVLYVGTGDLDWGEQPPGNFWSDYTGWDQDGDGLGDRPHRVNSFSASLIHRYPGATWLVRSPALELLSHLEEIIPILRVPTLIDASPVLEPAPQRDALLQSVSVSAGRR